MRFPMTLAATLAVAGLVGAKEPPKGGCGEYGTSLYFADTPADAAKEAKKAEKLVMVFHLSGHFEDPRFT